MATAGTVNNKKLRFQWLWTIESVENDCDSERAVPMREGDRLFLFFVSDTEVCFHRRGKTGYQNDSIWDKVRGTYCAQSDTITGTVVDENGDETQFSLKLEIDPDTGAGQLKGKHWYNPPAGHWVGRD